MNKVLAGGLYGGWYSLSRSKYLCSCKEHKFDYHCSEVVQFIAKPPKIAEGCHFFQMRWNYTFDKGEEQKEEERRREQKKSGSLVSLT